MTAIENSYAERYAEWVAKARPWLDAQRWKEAFAEGYPYVRYEGAPFTPLRHPLAACTIAPITSGGLYLPASQPPFDEPNPEGDQSYRTLPTALAPGGYAVAHGHYDPADALTDHNSVYPVDRLRELAAEGVIGGTTSTGWSFMGYVTDAGAFAAGSAAAIAREVVASGADTALLVPV
jgi:D-proline reductase (dithiol) PrdB